MRAVSQPTFALAESEIVLEGFFDGRLADECLGRDGPGVSLPEFLGYDGKAQRQLPVLTVTALTMRRSAPYQAVIGPGREQSTILGLAGALSVVWSLEGPMRELVNDACFSASGGGMLFLAIQIRKTCRQSDNSIEAIARHVFERHPFVKLAVFVDEDVNVASEEDVLWAVTTRANLATDCRALSDFPPLEMDPSQREDWSALRGGRRGGRSFIDATVPYELKNTTARSFSSMI